MSKYDDLVRKLKEIFQIDRPELDFGVYRILNARVGEINDYLENGLKAKVAESLAASGAGNLEALQKELKDKETQYRADGMDPDTVPKVKELRQKIVDLGSGGAEHENAVFTHLLTFFSRYYDKGDFISQRRYKGDTYAVPYAGEEVVLHWANKDQYYTKSGENFSNYGFKLDDGRTVKFRLVAADTAKDNRKDNDKERLFVLIDRHTRTLLDENGDEYEQEYLPIEEVGNELVIRFDYKAMPKGSKQDVLVSKAVDAILADPAVQARWLDLSRREPTEKNPQRTLLEKCLTSYTMKNSADYFIHKDLGGFLRRELDFYIKNEVMHLDDVQSAEKFSDIEKSLRLIQTLRAIALDLIIFLSQLEEFQKKLWLKKKFVVSTSYCITLDRVPRSLYQEVASNENQWKQWFELGLRDTHLAGSVIDLHEHPYLMVDTSLYPEFFKERLLADISDLDESINGLLIESDNFQALRLMSERFRGQARCIYIDPPYNTGQDGFLYKDNFKSSSWASMIGDRLHVGRNLLATEGVLFASIDKRERDSLVWQLREVFGASNFVEELIWVQDTVSNNAPTYSANHEYVEVFANHLPTVEANKSMFRETRQGYREVMELIDSLAPGFPSIQELEDALKTLYRDHQLTHRGEAEALGVSAEEAKKTDPWKGIYPYKHVEYRDSLGKLVPEDQAAEVGARPWVWREVEPSMPSGKQSPTTTDPDSPNYRFYCPPHPVSGKPCKAPKRGWSFPQHPLDGRPSYDAYVKDSRLYFKEEKDSIPQQKYFLHEVESIVATSVFRQYADGEPRLEALFGKKGLIQNPKPPGLMERLIRQTTEKNSLVVDFFAGSGSTGHAVVSVNRGDNGKRKFMLVEQGEYFTSVTKPRMQKVIYSDDWKEGKASSPALGTSSAFKVIKLESYEDTLNNLHLIRSQSQQNLLESMPSEAKEDYLLRYMLDVESRGSLLSVDQFKKPFDCKLKVSVDSAGAYEERTIDLVETFNYLIGLRVKHVDMQIDRGFVAVTGVLPSGEKALVLWRDVEKFSYDELNRLCDKLAINPADSEFDVVYINGDHNIPAVFTSTEAEGGITRTLKIRQIEPEFMSRMFNTEA